MENNGEVVSFNINAELYENHQGDLAVRFEGEKVFRNIGLTDEANFMDDAQRVIRAGDLPPGWVEMSPRELTYGPGWQLVSSMGFINGELDKPALELEVRKDELGSAARRYLGDVVN